MICFFCTKVGSKYSSEYVNKLYNMVKRNFSYDFKFVCTTDDNNGIISEVEVHKPALDCWGWWNLQEAYSNPDWCDGLPIVYFGLDTIIVDSIDCVVKRDKLTLHKDFSYMLETPPPLYKDTLADGVTYIPAGGVPEIWESWVEGFMSGYGDGRLFPMHVWNTQVIQEKNIAIDLWDDVEPDLICSYKWPKPKLEKPPQKIVCFHGVPNPEDVLRLEWVKDNWK